MSLLKRRKKTSKISSSDRPLSNVTYTRKNKHRGKKGRRNSKYGFFFRKILKYLRGFTIILFVTFMCLLIYAAFKRYDLLQIEQVDVFGGGEFVNANDVSNLANANIKDKNLLSLNSTALAKTLMENFQGAKNVKVSKNFPNGITIDITERTPLALVSAAENSTYLLDEDGYVLGLVADERNDLPKISYKEEVYVGEFIDENLVPVYLTLLESLEKENVKASSISVSKRDISLYTDSVEVNLSRNSNIEESIKVLSLALKQVFTEGKTITGIDLRYDKVIVSYE